jgi:acyl CoA:acetate/3-ketoacid CoA transferase beta subunit
MGVFDVTDKGLVLIEKASEFSLEDIRACTEANFTVSTDLKVMGI